MESTQVTYHGPVTGFALQKNMRKIIDTTFVSLKT
jgi:hypothetical protein